MTNLNNFSDFAINNSQQTQTVGGFRLRKLIKQAVVEVIDFVEDLMEEPAQELTATPEIIEDTMRNAYQVTEDTVIY